MRRILAFTAFLRLVVPALAADDYVPRDTQKDGGAPPTPEQAARLITVPEGFKVTLFAGEPDVRQPISMTLDDRGRLWVAESYSYKEWEKKTGDRILIFEDTDNDGRFDTRKVFWDKGKHVSSVEVGFGGVWVIDVPDLLFIPDRNGDDVPDSEPEVRLTGFTLKASHNMANGLRWGPDGYLYGRHGVLAKSSVDHPKALAKFNSRKEFDCAIWRIHPQHQRSGAHVFCRGMTNPWGMDWNADGEMFLSGNVNGHLWHAIKGGLYDRMFGQGDFPHAYRRLQPCADHAHHAGDWGNWTKARSSDGKGAHDSFGGGHSHCGLMIYRGDNWPEKYRGRAFLCNTHGRRVNQERLERQGSGYVAKHEEDFLLANNPWFKGVDMIYGPDGGVYLSDWCDFGECHDSDGVHRSSGRIYKITYGEANKIPSVLRDLSKLGNDRLVALQTHENAYFSGHARRILQERLGMRRDIHERDNILGDTPARKLATPKLRKEMEAFDGHVATLWSIAKTAESNEHRINALWTLKAIGDRDGEQGDALRVGGNEVTAAWSHGHGRGSYLSHEKLINGGHTTARSRLAIATATSSWGGSEVFELFTQLAQFEGDADDANLPLILWYKIEPLVPHHPDLALALARSSKIPLLTEFIARRMAQDDQLLTKLVEWLPTADPLATQRLCLKGMADGLAGLGEVTKPEAWDAYAKAAPPELATLVGKLDRLFNAPPQPALQDLFATLSDNGKRNGAIRALAKFDDPRVPQRLIAMFPNVVEKDQRTALGVLTGRVSNASALLEAIEIGELARSDLGAFHARQIELLGDADLSAKLASVWGQVRQPSEVKLKQIAAWKSKLTPDALKQADLQNGRRVFQRSCAACHALFGEGGKIGPELTDGNRRDLHYLLENIIDPNALLPDDFRMTILKLRDGSTVSGSVAAKTERATTVQTATDAVVVPNEAIASSETLAISTMPEGLIQTLAEPEVRDLIAYLRGDGPVPLPDEQ